MSGLLGKKLGMSTVFDEQGNTISVTVIEAGPCVVTQIRTKEKDGYESVQLGFGTVREKLVNKPAKGHLAKANSPLVRHLREFKDLDLNTIKLGTTLKVDDLFTAGDMVKVIGTSKGKGFQGVVKRHHFGGGPVSHGQSDRTRAPGSVGSSSYPSRSFKGQRMGGHMGMERVTVKNLVVVRVDGVNNLLLIKGAVPGHQHGIVEIRKIK